MAETTDPTPQPTVRTRSVINKRQLAELQTSEEILEVAKKADYAGNLAEREIDATFLQDLRGYIDYAETIVTAATGKTTEKKAVTGTEAGLRKVLIEHLRGVQKAAKQKSIRTKNQSYLQKYFVGDKFYSNRGLLEQTAATFIANAPADLLPGINAETIESIRDALAAYKSVQGTQTTAQSHATSARGTLAQTIEAVVLRRREIQIAADAAWPHTNPMNAGTRREFKLSPTKSFK